MASKEKTKQHSLTLEKTDSLDENYGAVKDLLSDGRITIENITNGEIQKELHQRI